MRVRVPWAMAFEADAAMVRAAQTLNSGLYVNIRSLLMVNPGSRGIAAVVGGNLGQELRNSALASGEDSEEGLDVGVGTRVAVAVEVRAAAAGRRPGELPAMQAKKASMSASVPISPSQLKSALPQVGMPPFWAKMAMSAWSTQPSWLRSAMARSPWPEA